MKVKWVKTRYQGVYYRKSQGQDHIHNGKPDKCFFVRYKKEGRRIMEKVGWGAEGYNAEVANGIRGERLRGIRHGEELPKEKEKVPRFSEMVKVYLKWAAENKVDSRNDESRYNNHLKDPLGKKRLNEISPFDLERLKSDLMKKDLAAATVKHCLVLVRMVINKAIQWHKYKGLNPVAAVKLPSLNNKRERFLSHEEADKLLTELKKVSENVYNQALLSLHCGLRAGEIFNLRGQDIDFQNGVIRIMDPKNKANRAAFMTLAVREMLKANAPENPNDLIFTDRWHGEKMELVSHTFDRVVKTLRFNDGVKDRRQRVVFHTLRHTFASWLAIQGTPLFTIRDLMGHRSIAMTERYSHLIPDVKRDATLALEAAFEHSRKPTETNLQVVR